MLTGNSEFRDVARTNFDLCYARAASRNLGGGLWWKVGVQSKNACVNGPGAIAAFLLGRATGEASYFTAATNIFLWERASLFDPATGRVFDNINVSGRVAHFALTYNQGTFVGAANLLGYTNEARLAATFTMNQLCHDGYLPAAGENGDSGGFNGIAVRWIARFMKERGEQATYESWLQKNAEAAWESRRSSDNLSWCRWPGFLDASGAEKLMGMQQRRSDPSSSSSVRTSETTNLKMKHSPRRVERGRAKSRRPV